MFPSYRDDLLQEGRQAIWKAIETYNGKAKLSTYAYVLVRNAVYDYANKMKLHYQYRPLPLNEDLLPSNRSINIEAAFVIEKMKESEYYDWLVDYYIMEDSQSKIAKRYNTNQQNVSRVIVDFRERMKEEFDIE
jgi:RNA polymerase sigma factor (sigma-70 family)